MTFAEAAGIMISGNSSPELKKPELITYVGVNDYEGILTEHYNKGTISEYTKKIRIHFANKGTLNEEILSLQFLNDDETVAETINFSGFYVG